MRQDGEADEAARRLVARHGARAQQAAIDAIVVALKAGDEPGARHGEAMLTILTRANDDEAAMTDDAMELTMNRSDLARAVADDQPHLARADIDRSVRIFFHEIARALAQGDRVELRGFGSFSTRARDARTGRNPRTGAEVAVHPKRVPHFYPGKDMRARVNAARGGASS